jgi:hypothetical protein
MEQAAAADVLHNPISDAGDPQFLLPVEPSYWMDARCS